LKRPRLSSAGRGREEEGSSSGAATQREGPSQRRRVARSQTLRSPEAAQPVGRLLSLTGQFLGLIAVAAGDAEVELALESLKEAARALDPSLDVDELRRHATTIRQALKDHALTERGLNFLIDTTHDLSSTRTLQDLLRTVVMRARSLIGADVAYLTVLDSERALFRVLTADGHLFPDTAEMTSRIDHGAVSLVMSSRGCFETLDYLNDKRFQHSPALDRIFQTEKIVSLAGFPILWENKLHGFLFVANRYARKLSGREMSVISTFALHAGVAMRNANAFALLSEALDEAQRNRNALIDHIQRVEASATAHDEMTDLLASGAGIRNFLEKMANQFGGAVLLYDNEFSISDEFVSKSYHGVLAEDLRSDRIDPALLIAANAQSRSTGRSVMMLERGAEQCRAIALHGGAGRRDSLVICHVGDLEAIEIRNLERSTVALSIAKLWSERRETEKQIASSTLLRHLVLVTPPDPPTVSAVRERLSLRLDQPVQLAVVAMPGLDRVSQTTRIREAAKGLPVLADLFEDAYLAVAPQEAMAPFLARLGKGAGETKIGGLLSEGFVDLNEACQHFARAHHAFQVVRKMKTLDRFLSQNDVNMFAKLFEVGDASRLADYADHVLQQITKRAPRHAAELRKTLLAYFDAQHNITRTSEALGLHINTVRQRLETLREAVGGWDDPIRTLELHVALRLKAILD
jgi:hypothetical protein